MKLVKCETCICYPSRWIITVNSCLENKRKENCLHSAFLEIKKILLDILRIIGLQFVLRQSTKD